MLAHRPIPISDRTKKIKAQYKTLPVPQEDNPYVDKKYRHFCTGDRWVTLAFLEGYLKHNDAYTSRLRRSYAEAEELYAAQPVITDDELLVGQLYLPDYTEAEQKRYDELCDMFIMSPSTLKMFGLRNTHLSLDFEKLLRLGINGLKAEIMAQMEKLDYDDPAVYPDYEVIRKDEFYRCCLIELDAVLDLASRYSQKAKELADKAEEPRRSELLRIAAVMERVPADPATTFYEAVQSVHFFLSNLFGLYPLGRPDRYLYPFYKEDIACGRLTKEEAQELIDNFCLGVSTRVFSRAACGFIVGGQDKDGNLIENDLTWMFITALDHIRQPDPNGALAVNEKTSDALLSYCAEVLSHGTTHPAFYNDTEIVRSLRNYGVSKEDSVNYIHTTCAEISVVGRSRAHTTAFKIDLPQILMDTVKANTACGNYEQLEQAYLAAIQNDVKSKPFAYFSRMLEGSRNSNDPMRVCCLVEDCIGRGRSILEGGERYTFIQPIFLGFATVTDSLVAIRKLVYEDKSLTLQEFVEIVLNNFEGNEALRQYIIRKMPHYGNDQEEADLTAKQFAEGIKKAFHEKMLGGHVMVPGSFSYVNHAKYGAQAGASFDGRGANYAYSDGCSPVQGRDTNGPTAMVLSLTSWDQAEFLGGMVVNIKFGAEHLSEKYRDRFLQVLRIFMQRGGLEMQVNVVDRQTLLDAREHPEEHGDLIVRIGGYSDYFVRLTPTLQQEIIDRTEY
ncbi:MAG: hypothetical protein IKM48_03590 [Clostridia bacterium]|nr:hypothetical protein [Clostridia bacterium]